MSKTSAQRVAEYRARKKASGDIDATRRFKPAHDKKYRDKSERPFCGCDGEGCGKDDLGRQLYMLFRMGDRELYTGKHLTTCQILDFICNHPADELLVGFSFGYDVTMILRDLPRSQIEKLLQPKTFEPGHSPYTWYRDFDIDYLPRNYFRVKRVQIIIGKDGKEKRVPIKGSTRTIYEVFGFFQKGFAKVIEQFEVGTPELRKMIKEQKLRRDEFIGMTDVEREYCHQECILLAEVMEKLRGYCKDAGIYPKQWSGAGKLAASLHTTHKTMQRDEVDHLPKELLDFASMAYYGGRFEVTRTGLISETVYEYDIRSAYPDAMRSLPCLHHGEWHKATAEELETCTDLYIAAVTFTHPLKNKGYGQLGGFPIRCKKGHLYWPQKGGGIYWSPEIESAKALGAKVKYSHGWIYKRCCDCKPFDWVEDLYNYRRSIGSSGAGYPIKLGINSLYGKLVQRKGNGKFHNMIWGGLITAITRAKLNRGISQAPDKIVMLATDALYSTVPLDLPVGENLGEWENAAIDNLFIVQPGLYWDRALQKRKSRGLSGKFFENDILLDGFYDAFKSWCDRDNSKCTDNPLPYLEVPAPGFIGIKLAMARGKPETAGCWVTANRKISFDYRNKRAGHIRDNTAIITGIIRGGINQLSLPHRDFLKSDALGAWENARLELEEQPEYIDLSIPFKE